MRPRYFLLVLFSLFMPAAWSQAVPPPADFQAALSGGAYPLTLKAKDLDGSWRRVSLNLPVPLNVALSQGFTPPAGGFGLQTPCYTKGQTVSVGSETFLVVYRVPVRYEMIPYPNERVDWGDALGRQATRDGDVTFSLSLVNVRQISSLGDIQAFTPQSPRTCESRSRPPPMKPRWTTSSRSAWP